MKSLQLLLKLVDLSDSFRRDVINTLEIRLDPKNVLAWYFV